MWFQSVKRYYNQGRYSIEDVKVFVKARKITAEQYQEITGEAYGEGD